MIFKNLYGNIDLVSLKTYDELIHAYVNVVRKVKGVESILQIGSFTTPGLSDIDIVVIVNDENPPEWDDISIKKILNGKEGSEVIVHDVFVYPQYLANYIEGLFYINAKKVLFGKDIGNVLPLEIANKLKLILSFEYAVNRLETLIILTSLDKISIRDALLFISTLRHTYKLLCDFNIITIEDRNERINKIEYLRKLSINNEQVDYGMKLNEWILPSFEAIYNSVLLLGERLNYNINGRGKCWVLNYKKLVFEINNSTEAVKFFKKNDTLNKRLKGRFIIQAMPGFIKNHINTYQKVKLLSKNDFDSFSKLPDLRYSLAIHHKNFLKRNGYRVAGSYTIIENKVPTYSDIIKRNILKAISFFPVFK